MFGKNVRMPALDELLPARDIEMSVPAKHYLTRA